MTPATPPTPATRFAGVIDLLGRATAARSDPRLGGGRLAGPLIILIYTRLHRFCTRFLALAARFAAGTLPAPRPRVRPPRPAAAVSGPPSPQLLPRGHAWLLRLVPGSDVATGAAQLRDLLDEPEMQALMAAAPQQAGRILRPLCRMLAVPLPDTLRQPRRPRRQTAPSPKPARTAPPRSAAPPHHAPRHPRRPAPASPPWHTAWNPAKVRV